MRNQEIIVGKPIAQPDRNAGSDLLRIFFIGLVFAVPLVIYIALSVKYLAIEYQISELITRKEELKRERAILLLKKERLLSLGAVEEIAGQKLGMVREAPTEIRTDFTQEEIKSALNKQKEGEPK
ncbi:MAG TPA: cell division protein FtsL [Acidobacteriota bacterium]|jgi:cell division protein FtsL|nr:cell division protein FtsL [Acidobacteriota bacterium]HNT17346.1 cell division protein FtsL [Acidobacteriota bacterium]HPA27242.1 cell division protein FtsL [Acidobacteriota bacterium]HQO19197.1 cell division protein FtsL [Acidobacteriota bacterium]HQQ47119.1 cell division protein FtsL [Acidobacteriota bacterium]